eukprot:9402941-Pyramimonas_sp.AAC.1
MAADAILSEASDASFSRLRWLVVSVSLMLSGEHITALAVGCSEYLSGSGSPLRTKQTSPPLICPMPATSWFSAVK